VKNLDSKADLRSDRRYSGSEPATTERRAVAGTYTA